MGSVRLGSAITDDNAMQVKRWSYRRELRIWFAILELGVFLFLGVFIQKKTWVSRSGCMAKGLSKRSLSSTHLTLLHICRRRFAAFPNDQIISDGHCPRLPRVSTSRNLDNSIDHADEKCRSSQRNLPATGERPMQYRNASESQLGRGRGDNPHLNSSVHCATKRKKAEFLMTGNHAKRLLWCSASLITRYIPKSSVASPRTSSRWSTIPDLIG